MGNDQEEREELAEKYRWLANYIDKVDIDSREKTIAMERLEESFMWASKGLFYVDDNNVEEVS